jgi:hypothetical protein
MLLCYFVILSSKKQPVQPVQAVHPQKQKIQHPPHPPQLRKNRDVLS